MEIGQWHVVCEFLRDTGESDLSKILSSVPSQINGLRVFATEDKDHYH